MWLVIISPDETVPKLFVSIQRRTATMKKLMTLALALSFLTATAVVSFAQDAPKKDSTDTTKKKKGKKKSDTTEKKGGSLY